MTAKIKASKQSPEARARLKEAGHLAQAARRMKILDFIYPVHANG